ncbi:MAG TPA: hydroxymethylglutaryl-CoA lyase [Actinomycetota bacterium]|nr:hydroxymethylglutaryl-CoA lyase [Actinomycetota bacterium]
MSALPSRVTIVEVGPRDGLQNESATVPTDAKVAFIDRLSQSGLTHIEATAFVSPKAIPQLADAEEVCNRIARTDGVVYSALVPNIKGYGRATEGAGLRDVAMFLSASETHNRKNIGCSIDEAFGRYREVADAAERDGVRVRGYVSTAFGCPYEGNVPIEQVVEVARRMLDLGVQQVSLGDTTGMGNPAQVMQTVAALAEHTPHDTIALHLHDTRGTGLANALAGLQAGVTTFDASTGGLGGCPYAPGATGNVATDELVYMLEAMGVETGVDPEILLQSAEIAGEAIGREPPSRYLKATRATQARERKENA